MSRPNMEEEGVDGKGELTEWAENKSEYFLLLANDSVGRV